MSDGEILIERETAGQRLDLVLRANIRQVSRAALQKAIATGRCQVDGRVERRPDFKVRLGQRVVIGLPEERSSLRPGEGGLDVFWHDQHLLVCNKPAGLTVHPCPSCQGDTLVQRLLARFPQLAEQQGLRPGIVHRLDKDTSGLLLVALSEGDRLALSRAFARHEVYKEYLALVAGFPPEEGRCSLPLGRHPAVKVKMAVVPEHQGGRSAETSWKRLWHTPDKRVSLLAVRIRTGRTHQIRVHLSCSGYPLLGDKLYAPKAVQAKARRQMLHAWRLGFTHPQSGERLRFAAAPPDDLPEAALGAFRRMRRLIITGNPGSGKSALARQFAARSIAGFSADAVVGGMYGRGGEVAQWLQRRSGDRLLTPGGAVDKAALFQAISGSPDFCRELEALVHPCVQNALENFWNEREQAGDALAVAEVPLYFECGWEKVFSPKPTAVGVHCPWTERLRRLAAERCWNEEKAALLESRQWNGERKMAACDLVVDNSDAQTDLAREAEKILRGLEERETGREREQREKLAALWGRGGIQNSPDWYV